MHDFAAILHASPAVEHDKPVIVPGEIGPRDLARQKAAGIALNAETFSMRQGRAQHTNQ
ncbi:MAG: hypothetical protein ABWY08_06815 [Comamonas sp.]